MNLHVSPLEFAWVSINLLTLAFTVTAFFDARADRTAVRLMNGKARELAASGIVRREGLRVIVQLLLLLVVVPSLFLPDGHPRPSALSALTIGCLMTVPVILLLSSFWDARDRKRMTVLVTAEALMTKTSHLDRIEQRVEDGIHISEMAYDAANHVKERFDAVNERITAGEDLATSRHAATAETIDSTASEVHDLHDGTAPK